MSDDLSLVDRVGEGLWQTINRIDGEVWLGVPEEEKEQWRARAKVAIADWKQANGYA